MKNKFLFFVVGATNAGKTTFMERIKKESPDAVHLVQVGKILRSKYPPEYFEGEAAPAKTQKEAIELVLQGIKEGSKYRYTFVDGQPRDVEQAKELSSLGFKSQPELLNTHIATIELVCPRDVRIERASKRDNDPAKLALSMQRMDKDILQIHEVLIHFGAYPQFTINTNAPSYNPLDAFGDVIIGIISRL